jgi:hypothetical protein
MWGVALMLMVALLFIAGVREMLTAKTTALITFSAMHAVGTPWAGAVSQVRCTIDGRRSKTSDGSQQLCAMGGRRRGPADTATLRPVNRQVQTSPGAPVKFRLCARNGHGGRDRTSCDPRTVAGWQLLPAG